MVFEYIPSNEENRLFLCLTVGKRREFHVRCQMSDDYKKAIYAGAKDGLIIHYTLIIDDSLTIGLHSYLIKIFSNRKEFIKLYFLNYIKHSPHVPNPVFFGC